MDSLERGNTSDAAPRVSRPSAEGDPSTSSTTNYVSMDIVLNEEANRQQSPPDDHNQLFPAPPPPHDDDELSLAPSIFSSVLTADGIHDITGFYCVCLVILIGDMTRGVMFPSMWPLVESLGGNSVTLGYSVASFSFGRVLVMPLFGSWSHTYGYTNTLTVASSILLVGTLVYAQVQTIGRPEFLIVAQTILGIGSGTLGVTRAFVADVTAKRHRTTYMAWITAVQYAGFTVTPFLGALFNQVFADSNYEWGIFRLNMYTAPAYFMTMCVAGTLVILRTFFRNRQRIETVQIPTKTTEQKMPNVTAKQETISGDIDDPIVRKSQRRQWIDQVANTNAFGWCGSAISTNIYLTIYDACILGCMLLNVATKGSIASFETLGIVVAQDAPFYLSSQQAGTIVASCGSVGVASLLGMGHLSQKWSDVQLISFGMIVMALGIVSLSWSSTTEYENDDGNTSNGVWRYCVSIFLIYAVGYPIGHTAVIGIFSKST